MVDSNVGKLLIFFIIVGRFFFKKFSVNFLFYIIKMFNVFILITYLNDIQAIQVLDFEISVPSS
jgi:hypothetical protein